MKNISQTIRLILRLAVLAILVLISLRHLGPVLGFCSIETTSYSDERWVNCRDFVRFPDKNTFSSIREAEFNFDNF